jgi:predicted phage-related endonuclease
MNKLIATTEQEFTVMQYHDINNKIKALDIYKDIITKQYFGSYEIMVNPSGVLLATYKNIKKEDFDRKRFQNDFPDTYEKYKKEIIYRSLLIK